MKTLDTQALISTLRDIITTEGRDVTLVISGSSMAPFLIHHRDAILFGPIERPLSRGDMVFYQRDNGQYVMHRIRGASADGRLFDIIGDAQTQTERNVRRDQIFAIVKRVRRNGRWIGPDAFLWRLFATVWLRIIPMRRAVMWAYAKVSAATSAK